MVDKSRFYTTQTSQKPLILAGKKHYCFHIAGFMQYKPIYTTKEAAELLSTSRNTVGELLRKGEIPYLRLNGARKIRGSDLERFIENYPVEIPGENGAAEG